MTTSHSAAWLERHWTSRCLHCVGDSLAHAAAGVIAAATVVTWAAIGAVSGFPTWWQTALYSATASVTFVMVFVIQHTHQRETSALQRKLDELIRSMPTADDRLIAVEEALDEDLRALTAANVAQRERVAARDRLSGAIEEPRL